MIILEIVIYLGILLLFYAAGNVHSDNVHSDFKQLSKGYKITLILFTCLLTAGQVTKSPHHTSPFTYWGMYSQAIPPQTFTEYLIELENGTVTHYPFELVTFTSQRAFMRRLHNTEQRLQGEENRELLHQTASRLAELYEKKNPGQAVRVFRINQVHITLTGDERGYTTTTHPLFEKELER